MGAGFCHDRDLHRDDDADAEIEVGGGGSVGFRAGGILAQGLPNKLGLVIAALVGVGVGMVLYYLLKESGEEENDPAE